MSYNEKLENYTSTVGGVVHFCNQFETIITAFILNHYFGNNDNLVREFSKHFLTRQGVTFQTLVTTFNDIINTHHKKLKENNSSILKKSFTNDLVKYRNILAHSSFANEKINTDVDSSVYALRWTSKSELLEELDIDDNYIFKLDMKVIKEHFDKAPELLTIVLKRLGELKNKRQI